MENVAVNKLMRLINPLSLESKLEILTKLSLELKLEYNKARIASKQEAKLDALFGAWKDMDDMVIDEILMSRTTSNRSISFD